MVQKQAKSPTEKGHNGDPPPEEVIVTPPEEVVTPPEEVTEPPEEVVKPPVVKGESENFEQKYKTLVGQNQKLQKDFNELKGQQTDFAGVSQKVDNLAGQIQHQATTLNLVVGILEESASISEEMQERVKRAKEAQETEQTRVAAERETIGKMGGIAEIAGMPPNDEALKPAFVALYKGEHSEAVKLTTIAVKTKIAGLQTVKPGDEGKKPADKEALKALNVVPAVQVDWRDKSATDKIKEAVAKQEE